MVANTLALSNTPLIATCPTGKVCFQVIIDSNFTRYFYCATKICGFPVSDISFSATCFLIALLFWQLYLLGTLSIINMSTLEISPFQPAGRKTCEQYFKAVSKHTAHPFCYILMTRTVAWSFLTVGRLGSKSSCVPRKKG